MIKNHTQDFVLAKNTKYAKSLFSKFMGLMFSRKITDTGLLFIFKKEKKISLHMFFVFYPIDVLWLNSNKEVVEIKRNFKPFTFYRPKNKAKYIIELPEGTIKKTKIKDKLNFN